ncbi:hypothetical protein ABIE06_004689 [Pantoea dispersa]|uniref:hypothetical protein n=1 Tax=Pantoea dispersa TaxID=59814 RepID=UPI003D257FED
MIDYALDLLVSKMVSSQVCQLVLVLCALPTAKLILVLAVLGMLMWLTKELKGS